MSTMNIRPPTNAQIKKNGPPTHPREQARIGAGIAPPTPRTANSEVTAERIRALAYETFQARQKIGTAGDAVSDWLCAEQTCSRGKGREMGTQDRGQSPGLDPRPDPPLIDPEAVYARQQLRSGM